MKRTPLACLIVLNVLVAACGGSESSSMSFETAQTYSPLIQSRAHKMKLSELDVSPLLAFEWNDAVAGTPPSGMPSVSITGADTRFRGKGDEWWVKDTSRDGYSAVARWWNYLADGTLHRQGACKNSMGYGDWGICNKDYSESSTVLWTACLYDGGTDTWIRCGSAGLEVPVTPLP